MLGTGQDNVEVGIRRELTAPLLHCASLTGAADGLAGTQRSLSAAYLGWGSGAHT